MEHQPLISFSCDCGSSEEFIVAVCCCGVHKPSLWENSPFLAFVCFSYFSEEQFLHNLVSISCSFVGGLKSMLLSVKDLKLAEFLKTTAKH